MPRRVAAVGYYGMTNFGDDLFQAVVRDKAGVLWPGADTRIWAPRTAATERPGSLRTSIARAYRSHGPAGSVTRLIAGLGALAWADTIALCGGSVLSTTRGVQALQAAAARFGWRRFEGVGVSIGPFPTVADEQDVRSFVRTFDDLVVRDEASMAQIDDWDIGFPVRLGGDLAGLFEYPDPRPGRPGPAPTIGIMPCNHPGFDHTAYTRGVTAVLDSAEERLGREAEVIVFSLNNHPTAGDDVITSGVRRTLQATGRRVRTHRYVEHGVRGTVEAIAALTCAVSTRLHGAIVSYLTGVPFVMVAYHLKCGDFARDIGLLPALCVDPGASCETWAEAGRHAVASAAWETGAEIYRKRCANAYLRAT